MANGAYSSIFLEICIMAIISEKLIGVTAPNTQTFLGWVGGFWALSRKDRNVLTEKQKKYRRTFLGGRGCHTPRWKLPSFFDKKSMYIFLGGGGNYESAHCDRYIIIAVRLI